MTDPLRGGDFELTLDGMPGDPASQPQDYEYRLPFDYGRVRVDQGPGGRFSHSDAQNLHAIDFAVPEGTRIVAAREGLVLDEVVRRARDLPNATDLASLDDHSAAVIVVPDRHHDGTNALLVPSDGVFEFCYGPGSFAAHCAKAQQLGLSLRVVDRPDLALDLDTLDDLRAAGL